jgi:uncharacterized membrane protein
MNKLRLEFLSDGVFAIVFTILVLELRVPEALMHPTSGELWHALSELTPLFVAYFVSFAVLTTFWMAHNFFFSEVVKIINRQLVLLNMLYLAFVSLVPFSTHLLGRYSDIQTAVLMYGINILIIAAVAALRFEYALWSGEIDTSHNNRREIAQGRVRAYVMVVTTLCGMLVSYVSLSSALFLYAFPIVFNIIPGLLNATERLLGFRLGSR